MKVYVLDVKRVRRFFERLIVLIMAVALTVGIILGVDSYITSEALDTGAPQDGASKIIILDPGHGGEDPGAVAADGALEKDLNLSLSFAIKEELEAKGFTVVMTRTEDKMLYGEGENIKGIRKLSDLKNRCKIGADYPDAIFISIHMNSFGSSEYSGLQVYYSHDDDESHELATAIQSSVKKELQNDNNRVVKDGKNIYILENCEPTSILIECGFLTNPEESKKLSEKEYQKQLSFAIVCGIIEYIKE